MDALRCPPDEAPVETLSGGEKRRVALCQLLLSQPELLLLDEPTNHLDAETVAWLEGHLRAYPGAILIVTHDRYFLDNVTGWILELDRGRGIPYQGNYSSWLEQKQKRLAQEGREEEARQRTIERERQWVSASQKARQAKSKARIQRYDDLVAKSQEKAATTAQIVIPIAERLGAERHRGRRPDQGLRRPRAHRRSLLQAAPRRHRRRDRAERGRQDHPVPDDRRPGEAGRGRDQGRRERRARLRRPVPRHARRRQDRVGGDLGRQRHHLSGQARDQFARLLLGLQLPGRRPAEEGGPALRAASATGCIWRRS